MPARLEISIENLKNNVLNIKKYIEENNLKKPQILAMVKADAYGAGIVEISRVLESVDINHLGVAYLKEARLLRNSGIKSNIVVFSGLLPENVDDAVCVDAEYAISNIEIAKLLNEKAKEKGVDVKVHIAVDTGMGRIGVLPKDIKKFANELKNFSNLKVQGIFSHFSSADSDNAYTVKQNKIFKECVDEFETSGIIPEYIHICNSIGMLEYPSSYNDLVRVGIGIYGYLNKQVASYHGLNLKGIFRLSAPICDIRTIDKGEAIGYSKTYITDKPTKIATIQIGYADGLNRLLSNKFSLNIAGKEAKILGNICMDMTMIDITGIDGLNIGDYVNIFDFEDTKLDEIAMICSTINYEIISTIGKRVDRKYID